MQRPRALNLPVVLTKHTARVQLSDDSRIFGSANVWMGQRGTKELNKGLHSPLSYSIVARWEAPQDARTIRLVGILMPIASAKIDERTSEIRPLRSRPFTGRGASTRANRISLT